MEKIDISEILKQEVAMDTEIHAHGPRRVALVAHDNKKDDLLAWASAHRDILKNHQLVATGTTGALVQEALGMPVRRFMSGPLGGDQQIGAAIARVRLTYLYSSGIH